MARISFARIKSFVIMTFTGTAEMPGAKDAPGISEIS
jgi:hypothetical protein